MTDELPDIVLVLRYYGAIINRTTGQVSVKCPFHNDSHASAGFSAKDNIFNCFTCGVQGNSIQIIAKQERCSIREAKSIAERITGQSNCQVRGEYTSGGRLPSKSRNNKGGGSGLSIRRSLGA